MGGEGFKAAEKSMATAVKNLEKATHGLVEAASRIDGSKLTIKEARDLASDFIDRITKASAELIQAHNALQSLFGSDVLTGKEWVKEVLEVFEEEPPVVPAAAEPATEAGAAAPAGGWEEPSSIGEGGQEDLGGTGGGGYEG